MERDSEEIPLCSLLGWDCRTRPPSYFVVQVLIEFSVFISPDAPGVC